MSSTTYHLESIALTMVFVSSVTFLCLAPALLRFASDFRGSVRSWIVGTGCIVLSDFVFFVAPGLPHAGTFLTLIAGLGVAEWLHALRLFNGPSGRSYWPWGVVALGTLISFVAATYPATVAVSSTLFAILYVALAWESGRIREPRRSVGRGLLVALFVLVASVMVGRVVLLVLGARSGAPPGYTSFPRAIMFIIASMGPTAASFAFVLACAERLGDRLVRWSLLDSLTGIPNRRAFVDSLHRALGRGRRQNAGVAVLVVDLDNLKKINDEAGHLAGDRALVAIARLLETVSRSEDVIGRLGGDEFALVVPDTDLETAVTIADRLRRGVAEKSLEIAGRSFDLTISIGVAFSTGEVEDAATLLDEADFYLYQAKERGRDRVEHAGPREILD